MARSKKSKSQPPAQETAQTSPPPPPPSPAAPAPPQEEQPQSAQPAAQQIAPPEGQEENPELMQKGIYISALVYIEGMQAPADDFAALAKSALADALSGEHKGLTFTLKKSHVENNVEDTEDSDESAGKKGSFEF